MGLERIEDALAGSVIGSESLERSLRKACSGLQMVGITEKDIKAALTRLL